MRDINYLYIDNMDYMRSLPDNYYDLAIADPEQGKNMDGGKQYSSNVIQQNGARIKVPGVFYPKRNWDSQPATEEYFSELFRVSKHQIIWGCQYYHTNFGKGRIIWDKCNQGSDQYDCEIAYTSLTERTVLWRYMWRGMMQGKSIKHGHIQQGNKALNEKKIHPTQKPTALYKWQFLEFNIPKDWKIFDPNLGSGSIGIACLEMGYKLDACENNKDQLQLAIDWLESEKLKKTQNPILI
nr:DNA methyltransferase [uncultured Carboxylicivirga sp.]